MTPERFRDIRLSLGLTLSEMGRALGYSGSRNVLNVQISRYEDGSRTIRPWVARLAEMYEIHGVPAKYLSPYES